MRREALVTTIVRLSVSNRKGVPHDAPSLRAVRQTWSPVTLSNAAM